MAKVVGGSIGSIDPVVRVEWWWSRVVIRTEAGSSARAEHGERSSADVGSGGLPYAVVQEPAEASLQHHLALGGTEVWRRVNDRAVQALVIALCVVMREVMLDRVLELGLAERDQVVQALVLDRAHEALGARGAVRTTSTPASSRVFRNTLV